MPEERGGGGGEKASWRRGDEDGAEWGIMDGISRGGRAKVQRGKGLGSGDGDLQLGFRVWALSRVGRLAE